MQVPKKSDNTLMIAFFTVTFSLLAIVGGIIYYKGTTQKKVVRNRADAARQKALRSGASKLKAEKEATLAMVSSPVERAQVEKEIEKLVGGKTEKQAEEAVKAYQEKLTEEKSGIVETLKEGVKETVADVKETASSVVETITGFVSNLKSVAESEYKFWKENGFVETSAGAKERLRKYWEEGTGNKWNGDTTTPWSAAFISYVMKKGGAGSDWKYSPAHADYIKATIKNRKENNSNPFKAYKPNEVKLAIGDLVGAPRGKTKDVTYDNALNYKNSAGQPRFESHTDLVVNIKNGYAETLGGNVGIGLKGDNKESVGITKVPLTADGKIDTVKAPKYIVVIKNNKA